MGALIYLAHKQKWKYTTYDVKAYIRNVSRFHHFLLKLFAFRADLGPQLFLLYFQ